MELMRKCVGRGTEAPCPLGTPPSQHPHVFTNPKLSAPTS